MVSCILTSAVQTVREQPCWASIELRMQVVGQCEG